MRLGDEEPGLKLQAIVEGEGVVIVLSDFGCGGASIEELELKGFVKVIASEVKLTADEGARGTTIDEGREYLGQAIDHGCFQAVCDVSHWGGVSVKEFEGNQGGEVSEGVGSKHRQGLIDEVISGATVD
ncbi:hypothetical protein C0989_006992 [Termitomyces sp. Mn162]|nr:hypothetical protein C0989_006992 [Termitomyces sp. Mn162]